MKIFTILILSTLIIQCRPSKKDPLSDFITFFFLQQLTTPSSCGVRTNQANGTVDPLLPLQWHLKNTGAFDGISGADSNVEPVWNENIKGRGIHINVVDDGVDLCHEDLQNNVDFSAGFNIDFTGRLPTQVNGGASCDNGNACHGTAVAGVAGAMGSNGIGGSGTAPGASLSGRNLLLSNNNNFAANIVTSMSQNIRNIHISNNSWGAPDTTGGYNNSLAFAGWKDAVRDGVTNGRGGKGSLYFWAGGNGGRIRFSNNSLSFPIDNSNYDGQANDPNVMAICAIGNEGKQVYYSENGANLLVCGYSEGDNNIRTTTTDIMGSAGYNFDSNVSNISDLLNNNYTNQFNGTSSATPNVAGVAALILEANPNLTWREVRWILATSAKKVDSVDNDWYENEAGFNINHKYGFGAVDANAAVQLAKSFNTPFSPQLESECTFPSLPVNTTLQFSECTISGSPIVKIESIEVSIVANQNVNMGSLYLDLTKMDGSTLLTESILNEPHLCFDSNFDLTNPCTDRSRSFSWKFSTLRHMDETANGGWRLYSRDIPIINSSSQNLTGNSASSASISAKIIIKGRAN